MKTSILMLSLTASLSVVAAHAATTTYADRTAFDAAAGTTTTETFNNCGTSTTSLQTDFVLSSSNLGPCSSLTPGISFAPDAGFNLYIAGPGQSGNADTSLGVDFPFEGHNLITFATGVTAFAADLFQNIGGGGQGTSAAKVNIDLFGVGGLIDSISATVAPTVGGFIGLTSSTEITSILISQSGGYAVIDNVSFGAQNIPEPGSVALLGLGFIGLGFTLRARRG